MHLITNFAPHIGPTADSRRHQAGLFLLPFFSLQFYESHTDYIYACGFPMLELNYLVKKEPFSSEPDAGVGPSTL